MANPRTIELLDDKYHRLTPLYAIRVAGKPARIRCQCDCGNYSTPQMSALKNGNTKSCGCLQRQAAKKIGKGRRFNASGMRFGRLVAREATSRRCSGSVMWLCDCDCSNTVVVSLSSLRQGLTVSCGCKRHESAVRSGRSKARGITGFKKGSLTALHPTEKRDGTCIVWAFKCDCGGPGCTGWHEARAHAVVSGHTTSCGAWRKDLHRFSNDSRPCWFYILQVNPDICPSDAPAVFKYGISTVDPKYRVGGHFSFRCAFLFNHAFDAFLAEQKCQLFATMQPALKEILESGYTETCTGVTEVREILSLLSACADEYQIVDTDSKQITDLSREIFR